MDTEEFEQAVRAHQRMVFSIAWNALRDRALAEEMTQEVFLALFQHGGQVASAEHLVYWLRRVTARKCVDQMRRQRWRRHLPLSGVEAAAGPAARMPSGDPLESERLQRLIRALPARTRVALVLRYQEDLDPAEIGRLLGVTEQVVRKTLRRALTTLKLRLGPPRDRATKVRDHLHRRVIAGPEL